jgi:hypothetical protein
MVRLTGNDTPGRKERTMTYSYENHVPSRAEIVIGMAADAIRRWRDRVQQPVMTLHGNRNLLHYLKHVRHGIGLMLVHMVNYRPIKGDDRLNGFRLNREEKCKPSSPTKADNRRAFPFNEGLCIKVIDPCLEVLHLELHKCVAGDMTHPLVSVLLGDWHRRPLPPIHSKANEAGLRNLCGDVFNIFGYARIAMRNDNGSISGDASSR